MLAYLFWHEPHDGVEPGPYVERLQAFHRALAAAPWDAGPARTPFEDWYLVSDWAALGTLNEAAVRAPRDAAHDAIAAMATNGAGGLYLLKHGTLDGPAPWAGWVVKPQGEPYDTFEPRLCAAVDAAGGGAVLRRQMVLGPAPEYALLAATEPDLPWPVRATGPAPL